MKTRDLAKVNVLFPPHDAACVKRANGNEAADDGATTGLAASVSPSREGGGARGGGSWGSSELQCGGCYIAGWLTLTDCT